MNPINALRSKVNGLKSRVMRGDGPPFLSQCILVSSIYCCSLFSTFVSICIMTANSALYFSIFQCLLQVTMYYLARLGTQTYLSVTHTCST